MKGPAGSFLLLVSAWWVYAICQEDFVLPALGLVAILAGAWRDRSGTPPQPPSLPGWLWAIFVLAPAVGWRTFLFKAPADAFSAAPWLVDSLQSATVLGAAGLWLLAGEAAQRVRLRLLAWLSVAFSANVSPRPVIVVSIAAFGLVHLLVQVGADWSLVRSGSRGQPRRWSPYLVPVVYAGMALGLIAWLAWGIQALDRTLDEFFIFGIEARSPVLDPVLRLGGGGPSARSSQAVLEIGRGGRGRLYLKAQVYEKYRRGGWLPPRESTRFRIRQDGPAGTVALDLFRLEFLSPTVPAPEGLRAVSVPARTDRNSLLYELSGAPTQRLRFHVDPTGGQAPTELSLALRAALVEVPAGLRPELLSIVQPLAEGAKNPREVAERVESYFRNGFQYSLDVNFPSGDEALLEFLRERRPAYCSYFASAMALLLRTQDIPARVAGGFLAMEVDRGDPDRFIVRLRDAHAWTEVYLRDRWVRFDPTPVNARNDVVEHSGETNQTMDRFSRWLRRTWVELTEAGPLAVLQSIVYPWLLLAILAWILGRELRRQFKTRRRRTPALKAEAQRRELLQAYVRFEAVLRRVQPQPRSLQETDRELLHRLRHMPALSADFTEAVDRFVRLYQSTRFGLAETGFAETQGLEEALRHLESVASRRTATDSPTAP